MHRDLSFLSHVGLFVGAVKTAVVPVSVKDWVYIVLVAGTLVYGAGTQVQRITALEQRGGEFASKADIEAVTSRWELVYKRQERLEALLLRILSGSHHIDPVGTQ